MTLKHAGEIIAALKKFNNFRECIIENLILEKYCTTVSATINYIWNENFSLRPNISSKKIIRLNFHIVQEFRIRNDLTPIMMENIHELNWGFNEVSQISLENESSLLQSYGHLNKELHHIAFLWEDSKRFDLVCSEIEILQSE